MKITYRAVLPIPAEEAFGFVADPDNWPLFSPGVRDVDKADDWGHVGGHARLTSMVLGRPLTMNLELTEWDPPNAFRYTVSRGGGPGDDDNRRTFQPVQGGTQLTGTTEVPTRRGALGLLDRLAMLLVRAIFAKAMSRLPTAAVRHRQDGEPGRDDAGLGAVPGHGRATHAGDLRLEHADPAAADRGVLDGPCGVEQPEGDPAQPGLPSDDRADASAVPSPPHNHAGHSPHHLHAH